MVVVVVVVMMLMIVMMIIMIMLMITMQVLGMGQEHTAYVLRDWLISRQVTIDEWRVLCDV